MMTFVDIMLLTFSNLCLQEMGTMKSIGQHKNLVNFLGCCTQDGPLWLILEFAAHGNLRDFLRKHRPTSESASCEETAAGGGGCVTLSPPHRIVYKDLLSFSRQCAKGMEYLAHLKVQKSKYKEKYMFMCSDPSTIKPSMILRTDFGLFAPL